MGLLETAGEKTGAELLFKSYLDKILAVVSSVCLLAISVIILNTPPASGFELTIYDAFPLIFWILIILCNICGILIIIHNAFSLIRSRWWIAGLVIVLLSNSIILALPVFRGYGFFPHGDAMTHVGMMKDIITTGHIGNGNFYPLIHLLGVSLLFTTGLPENIVVNTIVIFWNIVHILNIYLLATAITRRTGKALLITALACPLVFSFMQVVIHPSMISLILVSLLLFLFHKTDRRTHGFNSSLILLIMVAVTITLAHPVTAVYAVGMLLLINIFRAIFRLFSRQKPNKLQPNLMGIRFNVSIIMMIIYFGWYFPFEAIRVDIKSIYDFLFFKSSESLLAQQTGMLSASGISLGQTAVLFIYRYAAILIIGAMSSFASLYSLIKTFSARSRINIFNFTYALVFVFSLGFSIFSLIEYTGEFEPSRISRFFLVTGPLISGLVCYDIIVRYKSRQCAASAQRTSALKPRKLRIVSIHGISLIVLLLLTASILGILNIYGTPRTIYSNAQITRMSIEGTQWFSQHQNGKYLISESNIYLNLFEDYNFGFETKKFNSLKQIDINPIPSNFGYDLNDSIKKTYHDKETYLLICSIDWMDITILPWNVRSKAHNYTDFTRLNSDPGILEAYNNGEFQVWIVD